MNTTVFLAEVIGWYLVIMSLFVLFRRHKIDVILIELARFPALLFFMGIITLILGLIMVVTHNIWVWDWPLIITLISWTVLITGVFRLVSPEVSVRLGQWWFTHHIYLYALMIINLLIGIFLLYQAFWY